jgi:endonuclease YncB( thermonuclease family)
MPKSRKRGGNFRAACGLAATLGLTATAQLSMAQNQEIRGIATALDGGRLSIEGRKVRLFGIEAPAKAQKCEINAAVTRCGIVAWAALIRRAEGVYLSCDIEAKSKPTPGHIVATCYAGEHDIGEYLVRSGWAKAVRAETERYKVDEEDARQAERGLWKARILPLEKSAVTPADKPIREAKPPVKKAETPGKPKISEKKAEIEPKKDVSEKKPVEAAPLKAKIDLKPLKKAPPASEPAAKPATKTETKTETKPATQPATQPTTEPAKKPAGKAAEPPAPRKQPVKTVEQAPLPPPQKPAPPKAAGTAPAAPGAKPPQAPKTPPSIADNQPAAAAAPEKDERNFLERLFGIGEGDGAAEPQVPAEGALEIIEDSTQ